MPSHVVYGVKFMVYVVYDYVLSLVTWNDGENLGFRDTPGF